MPVNNYGDCIYLYVILEHLRLPVFLIFVQFLLCNSYDSLKSNILDIYIYENTSYMSAIASGL